MTKAFWHIIILLTVNFFYIQNEEIIKMPVYSFQCNDCGHKFDKFFFRIGQKENMLCPKCKSNQTTKQISATNTHSPEKESSPTRCLPKFGFG